MNTLAELISRIQKFRGEFIGDGVNPGVTKTELLAALAKQQATPPSAPKSVAVLTDEWIDTRICEYVYLRSGYEAEQYSELRLFARAVEAKVCAELAQVKKQQAARSTTLGKYADVLTPFVAAMEAELHANSAKGDRPGWLSMSREVALLEIYWHTAKLSAAVKNNDAALIREYCADVANMAMMLLDVCGGLDTIVKCSRCGSSSAMQCNGIGCFALEGQDSAPTDPN